MRRQHVPGPLVFTGDDVLGAQRLIDDLLPLACAVLRLDSSTALKITNLLRADLDLLAPVFDGAPARVASIVSLADHAHMSRSSLYAALPGLAEQATRCGIAVITLLAARGDLGDSFAWRLCEIDSPVGREAKGPGIVGSRQRLFGISLVGADVDFPAILITPTDHFDKPRLLSDVQRMLGDVLGIAAEIRRYAVYGDGSLLAHLGLSKAAVANRDLTPAFLATDLQVGSPGPAGWEQSLTLGDTSVGVDAVRRGFASAVVETNRGGPGSPDADSRRWRRVPSDELRRLIGVVAVDLDITIRPSLATYWISDDIRGGTSFTDASSWGPNQRVRTQPQPI